MSASSPATGSSPVTGSSPLTGSSPVTGTPPVTGTLPVATRREAIAAAALAALVAPAGARAQRSDIAVLIRLVAREEATAEAYGERPGELLPRLYNDERDHAAALRTHLDALGRRPAPRGLDAPARRLVAAGPDAQLEAAIDLERSLVAEYSTALADIADPGVLQTAATILASHAQHLARLEARAVA